MDPLPLHNREKQMKGVDLVFQTVKKIFGLFFSQHYSCLTHALQVCSFTSFQSADPFVQQHD